MEFAEKICEKLWTSVKKGECGWGEAWRRSLRENPHDAEERFLTARPGAQKTRGGNSRVAPFGTTMRCCAGHEGSTKPNVEKRQS